MLKDTHAQNTPNVAFKFYRQHLPLKQTFSNAYTQPEPPIKKRPYVAAFVCTL